MDWRENWLCPINDRLSILYPELTDLELINCNTLCKEVKKSANNFIFDNPIQNGAEISFIDFVLFKALMIEKYDWINDDNLRRLYSKSCYYA